MEALLTKGMAKRILRYDIETYHKLGASGAIPRNTELIHGVIIHKMTISPIHRKIVNKLRNILEKVIPKGFIVLQESPISIKDSEPEPDISIVKGSYDDYGDEHPNTAELVIEVAYSSLEDDLEKANIYASANVTFYWILDIQNKKTHVFHTPKNNQYMVHTVFDSSIKIKIPHIEKEISLSEIL